MKQETANVFSLFHFNRIAFEGMLNDDLSNSLDRLVSIQEISIEKIMSFFHQAISINNLNSKTTLEEIDIA